MKFNSIYRKLRFLGEERITLRLICKEKGINHLNFLYSLHERKLNAMISRKKIKIYQINSFIQNKLLCFYLSLKLFLIRFSVSAPVAKFTIYVYFLYSSVIFSVLLPFIEYEKHVDQWLLNYIIISKSVTETMELLSQASQNKK